MTVNTQTGKMEINIIPNGKLTKAQFEELLGCKIICEYCKKGELPTEEAVQEMIDYVIENFD